MITRELFENKKQKLLTSLKNQKEFRLHKKTSNLFRDRTSEKKTIDVRDFTHVISVDTSKEIAEVEGMITYEDFVRETLKHGYMPAVVPELKTITVGGALTGGGVESSSFKYGYVHETVTETEILLSNATTVICTPTKNKDLFYGFANSYGTLGYALRVKVKLVKVLPYVKLTHTKYSDQKTFFKAIAEASENKQNDFVDAVVFNKNTILLTTGRFVSKAPFTNSYTFMKIYYKSLLRQKEDYLTISDYIWRWDTDWFWCGRAFGIQNPVLRFLLGIFGKLRSDTYWKVNAFVRKNTFLRNKFLSGKESVVQDIEIPIENGKKFLDFFLEKIPIRPIWICPAFSFDKKYPLFQTKSNKMYLNFGFWSTVPAKKEIGWHNKLIERKVLELRGKKSLYSESYFSKETFWKEYNKKAYDMLKKKYDSEKKLKDLYEKCVLRK